jgi:hypothetical protein
MAEKQEQQIQTAIRLPKSLIARIDKIAGRMSQPGVSPITRSEAMRLCIAQGADKLEQGVKLARVKR